MGEAASPTESRRGPGVDDVYRVFLSRFDERGARAVGSSVPPGGAEFLPLLFEELQAVSRSLESLDAEMAALLAAGPGPDRWRRLDRWRAELDRARRRLTLIARSADVAPQDPKEWNLEAMFDECAALLAGETRTRNITLSVRGETDLPPVAFRHPRPEQALFSVLRAIAECDELSGGRMAVRLTRVGDRCIAEICVHHGNTLLDRGRIPLAGLLSLTLTDGVRIHWEATPGRFVLRMECPGRPAPDGESPAPKSAADLSPR